MKKILEFSLLLVALVCVFAAVLSISASAATYPINGEDGGGNIKWSLDEDGVLLVTPLNTSAENSWLNFRDYHASGSVASSWEIFWNKYKDNVISVVIENREHFEVTELKGGINHSSSLRSIIFPSTVTGISRGGGYAFIGNTALTTLGPVGTPEGVVDLRNIRAVNWGDYDTKNFMRDCSSVTEVWLPQDLTQIYSNMFLRCTSLKRIEIGEKVASFSNGAFQECTSLEEVVFLGTNINNATAFSGCTAIKRITLSQNLSFIAEGVFDELGNVTYYVYSGTFAHEWVKENGKKFEIVLNRGMNFDGYNVRTHSYNGLRAIFFFDKDAIKQNSGCTLLEYGALVTNAENKAAYGAEISFKYENGNGISTAPKNAILAPVYTTSGGSGAITGNVLDNPKDPVSKSNSVYFALTVVDFEDNFSSEVYITGYEVWRDSAGAIHIIYTDYGYDKSHDPKYTMTSLYETYLGIYKAGLVSRDDDADGTIKDVLLLGGAVELDSSLYTAEDAKSANAEGFGDSFRAVDIPVVKQSLSDGTLTLENSEITYTLLHDINNEGKYVLLLGGKGALPSDDTSSGILSQFSPDWYSTTSIKKIEGSRPNPVFNEKVAENIDYVIIDDGITTLGASALCDLSASTLVYSKTVTCFEENSYNEKLKTIFAAGTTKRPGSHSFPYFYDLTINGHSIEDFAFFSHTSNFSYVEENNKFTVLTNDLSLKFERELTGKGIPVAKTMKTGMHYIIISASSSNVNDYSIEYKNGNIYFSGSFLSVDEAADVFVSEVLGYGEGSRGFGNALNITPEEISREGSLGLTVPYTKAELLQLYKKADSDDGMVLSGTHTWGTGTGSNSNGTDIGQTVDKSIAFTGKAPAILEIDIGKYSPFIRAHYGTDYFRDYDLSKLVSEALQHVSEGGIIMVCQHVGNPNPANTETHYSGKIGNDQKWAELMTDGTELNEGFKDTVDGMRRLTQAFKANGIPFVFRPFHELNGDWFWWCSIQRWKGPLLTQKTMADIWRFYYEMVTEEWGVDNALWVYSPSSGGPSYTGNVQTVVEPMYAYPGDDYVDIIGEDWYTSGLADSYNYNGNYESLMATGKPTGICEFGYRDSEGYPQSEYSALDFLETLKKMMSEGLDVAFFSTWTWTDSIFSRPNAKEFMNDELIITRDELLTYWNNN